MERASEARVADVHEPIALGDRLARTASGAMREHAADLKKRGVPTVIDPGQQLINFDRDELLELLDGARVFVVNDYEWALTLERTGLAEAELAQRAVRSS